MTRGIVFFLVGSGMDPMLPASLYSLRNNYTGRAHFVCNDVSDWFKRNIEALPGFTWSKETPNKYWHNRRTARRRTNIFCRKAYHHMGDYPFDNNLFMDLDILWQMPMDNHPIFDLCEQHGMVTCPIGSSLNGGFLERRRNAMNDVFGLDMPVLFHTNAGVTCAIKNSDAVKEWIRKIDIMRDYRGKYVKQKLHRSAEELPLSVLYTQGMAAGMIPEQILVSVGFKFLWRTKLDLTGKNIHGAGGSLVALKDYWQAYDRAVQYNFMDINSILTKELRDKFDAYKAAAYYPKKSNALDKGA